MGRLDNIINVRFIAGFGPIVRDAIASRKLYSEDLGIAFKEEDGGYLHTENLKGANSFALWPLSHAAQSCFGRDSWPEELQVPQAWLEFGGRCGEGDGGVGSARVSNAREKPERALGADSEPILIAGRCFGRDYFHSVDAEREIALHFVGCAGLLRAAASRR
jgi:hypothetical protein